MSRHTPENAPHPASHTSQLHMYSLYINHIDALRTYICIMRVRAHITPLPHSIYIYIIKRGCAHALKCGATRLLLLDMVYNRIRIARTPPPSICSLRGWHISLPVMRQHTISLLCEARRENLAPDIESALLLARARVRLDVYIYIGNETRHAKPFTPPLWRASPARSVTFYIYCMLLIWFVRGGRQTELNRERSLIMRVASREARLPGDASSADINQIYTEIAPTRDHAHIHIVMGVVYNNLKMHFSGVWCAALRLFDCSGAWWCASNGSIHIF